MLITIQSRKEARPVSQFIDSGFQMGGSREGTGAAVACPPPILLMGRKFRSVNPRDKWRGDCLELERKIRQGLIKKHFQT